MTEQTTDTERQLSELWARIANLEAQCDEAWADLADRESVLLDALDSSGDYLAEISALRDECDELRAKVARVEALARNARARMDVPELRGIRRMLVDLEALESALDMEAALAGGDDRESPSYHDLHITTAEIPRASIFNLPYGYEATCNRVGGWCLWRDKRLVAGEYGDDGLRLDVGGSIIVDSLGGGDRG